MKTRGSHFFSSLLSIVVIGASVVAAPAVARAQSYEIVQSFELPPARPEGELCFANGELLGTSPSGGDYDGGTIFEVEASGRLQILHSFGAPDAGDAGLYPFGGLAYVPDDPAGPAFYGTTVGGGAHAKGTVFRFVPGQSPQVVYSFDGTTDGWGPRNSLLRASDGFLYGSTAGGGLNGYGTLFRYQPGGVLTSFFSLPSGEYVFRSELAQGPDAVYAVSYHTSGYVNGVVYRVSATGGAPQASIFATINGSDPAINSVVGYPNGIVATQKALYVTSDFSGSHGTVVRIPLETRQASLVHAFPAAADGRNPDAALVKESETVLGDVVETTFLGATRDGGASGYGTVFRLRVAEGPGSSFSSTVVTLDSFDPLSEGREPLTSIVQGPGGFYGTTWGGVAGDRGGVYRIADGLELVVAFGRQGPGSLGFSPAGLTSRPDGSHYGVTWLGGDGGQGTLFSRDTAGTEVRASFAPRSSVYEQSKVSRPVLGPDQRYYLTTEFGGDDHKGAILRLGPDGQGVETVHSFNGADGARPQELVACPDGRLYGAALGSPYGVGTVFAYDVTSGFEVVWAFSDPALGLYPIGTLACDAEGVVYGVTNSGGSNFNGTVFSLRRTGTGWSHTVLHLFDYVNGTTPYAGLTLASDGLLYGTTAGRGRPSDGTVFRIARDGTGFLQLHDFTGQEDGCMPAATLVEAPDGWIYGTAGGGYFCQLLPGWWGSVFRVHPTSRAFEVLKTFDRSSGATPQASLVPAADGSLYGTTTAGGPRGGGVVFRIVWAVADAGGPYSVDEGGSVALSATCNQEGATFEWDLDGDGAFDDATGAIATFSAAGLDGGSTPTRRTVRVRATYGDGLSVEDAAFVDVANVPPTVTVGPNASLIAGEALLQSGSIADPGPDTFTGTVVWGDGSAPETLVIDARSFSLRHVYSAPGTFVVTVTVTDDDGGAGTGTFTVSVSTVEDSIAGLIARVRLLVASGVLNQGQGGSLIAKLEAALSQLANGKVDAAVNQIEAFINEVAADIASGKLPASIGEPLIDTARRAIAALG